MTNLSRLTTLLQNFFDPKGPIPHEPPSMLRSFLLFLMTNPEIEITKWIDQTKRVLVYLRRKSTCNCRAQSITDYNHPRIYSQPDCNSGWDSSREKHFNGYHIYMLSAGDSPYDLPLYPILQLASRHDAVSLVVSSCEFKQRFTLGTIDRMLLDAAHDADAIYHLLDHQKTKPFIDLNNRSKKNTPTKSDISISPKGIPICSLALDVLTFRLPRCYYPYNR